MDDSNLGILHPGMFICLVDTDRKMFITWNGSATFRVFTEDSDLSLIETDIFTDTDVKNINDAIESAAEWLAMNTNEDGDVA